MKKTIYFLIFILLLTNAYSTCTIERDEDVYKPSETITFNMVCTSPLEENQAYVIQLYNGTAVYDTILGTTPENKNTIFFATYDFPSDVVWTNAYANLTGTNLEGTTSLFNVTGNNSKLLIINDAQFSPEARIGKIFAVNFEINDIDGNAIDGAECSIYGTDQNEAPLQSCTSDGNFVRSYNGRATCDGILSDNFIENNQYLAEVSCTCGNGDHACTSIDNAGVTYEGYAGGTTFVFTVDDWLGVNTVTDKSEYMGDQEIYVCANLSNFNYSFRVPVEIYHQIRCGDNDSSFFRALEASDDNMPDERGISANTTQMQCKRFIVPESKKLQARTNTCYASTTVWVLNDKRQKIKSYATTSPVFNITIEDMNVDVDWLYQGNGQFNTIINLSDSDYDEYRGEGVGNLDIRINRPIESIRAEEQDKLQAIDFNSFSFASKISTVTATDINGNDIDYNIEHLNDGNVEIELKDVTRNSTGYYDVTVTFDLEEENMSSVAVIGFFTLLTLCLFYIPVYFESFTKNKFSNYLIKKSLIVFAMFCLLMTTTMVFSIVDKYNLGVDGLVRVSMFIIQWSIYVLLLWTVWGGLLKGLDLYKEQKNVER